MENTDDEVDLMKTESCKSGLEFLDFLDPPYFEFMELSQYPDIILCKLSNCLNPLYF